MAPVHFSTDVGPVFDNSRFLWFRSSERELDYGSGQIRRSECFLGKYS